MEGQNNWTNTGKPAEIEADGQDAKTRKHILNLGIRTHSTESVAMQEDIQILLLWKAMEMNFT